MEKILFAFRLDSELKNKLIQIAREKRRTTSDLIRIILEDFVKQQESL